ncbi:hypothetical protein BGZ94_000685, partial [Podila epigama]
MRSTLVAATALLTETTQQPLQQDLPQLSQSFSTYPPTPLLRAPFNGAPPFIAAPTVPSHLTAERTVNFEQHATAIHPLSSISVMHTDTCKALMNESSRPTSSHDPSQRFNVLERLGFGSSGSSVFKAVDKYDGNKVVAIKKIPLSVMTDGPNGNEATLEQDVDYFVSWIADHCCTEAKDDEEREISASNSSSSGSGHDGVTDSIIVQEANGEDGILASLHYYPRRRRSIGNQGSDTKGLDQLVKCLGCHRDANELWLSLEYCGGGSVADLIRLSDGPLTESEIGWVMSQILLGLAYLHSKGHVHGDIKAGNILLTADGYVKLGGSGSIMDHKEGAGERKRRRRSLTMSEFPASWLAPESTPATPLTPSTSYSFQESNSFSTLAMPEASTETDIWALGVACIELSQGRPPRPETPIMVSYGEQRMTSTLTLSPSRSFGNIADMTTAATTNTTQATSSNPWSNFGVANVGDMNGTMMMMGLSEELWVFIGRCLTPEPEARPTVHELLQDPFIEKYRGQLSQELLGRIRRMMEFVDQCAVISSDGLLQDASLTLSPLKATQLCDQNLEDERIGPWLIPMVRPRVDSVYDESSYFDQSGLPTTPPDQRADPEMAKLLAEWKHQRVSHPVVKQALMRDRVGYITFRHSRSPSLATIPENQLLEDQIYLGSASTTESESVETSDYDDDEEEEDAEEEEKQQVRVDEDMDKDGNIVDVDVDDDAEEFEEYVMEFELNSEVASVISRHTSQERLRYQTGAGVRIRAGEGVGAEGLVVDYSGYYQQWHRFEDTAVHGGEARVAGADKVGYYGEEGDDDMRIEIVQEDLELQEKMHQGSNGVTAASQLLSPSPSPSPPPTSTPTPTSSRSSSSSSTNYSRRTEAVFPGPAYSLPLAIAGTSLQTSSHGVTVPNGVKMMTTTLSSSAVSGLPEQQQQQQHHPLQLQLQQHPHQQQQPHSRATPSPSSIPAFIRPRTISTTSTATNSSVSTVTPNKSLERMLMMMRRTDKTMVATDLSQHEEYQDYDDDEEEDDDDDDEYEEEEKEDGEESEMNEDSEQGDDDYNKIRSSWRSQGVEVEIHGRSADMRGREEWARVLLGRKKEEFEGVKDRDNDQQTGEARHSGNMSTVSRVNGRDGDGKDGGENKDNDDEDDDDDNRSIIRRPKESQSAGSRWRGLTTMSKGRSRQAKDEVHGSRASTGKAKQVKNGHSGDERDDGEGDDEGDALMMMMMMANRTSPHAQRRRYSLQHDVKSTLLERGRRVGHEILQGPSSFDRPEGSMYQESQGTEERRGTWGPDKSRRRSFVLIMSALSSSSSSSSPSSSSRGFMPWSRRQSVPNVSSSRFSSHTGDYGQGSIHASGSGVGSGEDTKGGRGGRGGDESSGSCVTNGSMSMEDRTRSGVTKGKGLLRWIRQEWSSRVKRRSSISLEHGQEHGQGQEQDQMLERV